MFKSGQSLGVLRPGFNFINGNGGGGSVMSDAFIAANTGLTSTEEDATVAYVDELHTAGVVDKDVPANSKIPMLHIIVGDTATKQSYNLIDPTTFQLVWNGGWTHSSTGALGNGVNSFADPSFIPSVNITSINANSLFTGYRTNVNEGSPEGVISGGQRWRMWPRSGGLHQGESFNNGSGSTASSDSRGLTAMTRTTSTNVIFSDKGTNTNKTSSVIHVLPITYSVYFGAYNNGGTAASFSSKEWIGGGVANAALTATELTDFNTAFDNFNTALSRKSW